MLSARLPHHSRPSGVKPLMCTAWLGMPRKRKPARSTWKSGGLPLWASAGGVWYRAPKTQTARHASHVPALAAARFPARAARRRCAVAQRDAAFANGGRACSRMAASRYPANGPAAERPARVTAPPHAGAVRGRSHQRSTRAPSRRAGCGACCAARCARCARLRGPMRPESGGRWQAGSRGECGRYGGRYIHRRALPVFEAVAQHAAQLGGLHRLFEEH